MEKELISIVIPVYNRANVICSTIDNLLEQTYKNIEIIVVDDGSNDDIDLVMKKYSLNKKIKYIKSSKNSGACHARNIGIDASKGKYIAFQDSDDTWKQEKLYKQLEYLKLKDADICICGMNLHYQNGSVKKFHSNEFTDKNINIENQLGKSFFSTQLIFGKKECFIIEKFDEKFPRFQDWDLGIRLVKRFKVVYMSDTCVDRYLQNDSISVNSEKGYKAGKLLLEKYSEDYSKYPKAKAIFLSFYSRFQELNNISSGDSLKYALKHNFSIKTLVKFIAQKLGIYRLYLKKKERKR